MLKGFRDFIMRGNVIDLAVGIIIGAAFTTVVNAVVNDVFNPVIGAIFGQPDLSAWNITLRPGTEATEASVLGIGSLLTAVIQFLIVAAALYFAIVLPLNKLAERRKRGEEPEPAAPAEDVLLLQEIRDLLAARHGEDRSAV